MKQEQYQTKQKPGIEYRTVAAYYYQDENGSPLFRVVRQDPKAFYQQRPDGNGGWISDMKGVHLVPYRLPEIMQSSEVIIVEGEKDCEALAALGFCNVTTNPMGAGKWRKEYSQFLKGKVVYLIPDNDEPGREHMRGVWRALVGAAKSIRLVTLTGLRDKGDISDFIASCKDKDEATEKISSLLAEAKELKPAGPKTRQHQELEQYFGTKVDFLFRQHIPAAMPAMVNGREGTGKTTICLGMSKEILDTHPEGFVAWVACEGQTFNTMIQAKEIGLSKHDRFRYAELEDHNYLFRFDNKVHLAKFDQLLKDLRQEGPILAVFVDSIRGMTAFGDNESEVGKVMNGLNALVCDKHRAALIYIDHWKKGSTGGAHQLLDKVSGTTAKAAAVRVILSVQPASKLKRQLLEAKNNLGRPIPPLDVLKPKGRIVFVESRQETEQTKRDRAEEILFDLFSSRSAIPVSEIHQAAERAEISMQTFKDVKAALGIESTKTGTDWAWRWTISLEKPSLPSLGGNG